MNVFGKTLAVAAALALASPAAAQNPGGPPPAGTSPPGAPAMQQQGGTVRGTVADAQSGRPVGTAQVAVWSAADSTLVTGAVARPDGAFRIEGLRPGRYYLKISSLGFSTFTTPTVAITPQQREADVGAIRLAQGSVVLEGLTVTAEAAPAGFAADRNTYSTRDMPSTAGGNATDVLRNVPAVEVDQDGKVSLRGNQNVAVQVNGRASPMTGDQLGNFLQSLPAAMVERVEVIPNPSARYEPEGMAGIINIVLKQNADLGLSGGFIGGVGTGGRYNGSGNLGWQRGPLTLYGSYGFRHDQRENTGFNYTEFYPIAGAPRPSRVTDTDVLGRFDMTSHIFNGSADYKLSARDVLSATGMVSTGDFNIGNESDYLETDAASTPVRRYRGETGTGADDLTFDGSLLFKRTITPQRHELSLELRGNQLNNEHVVTLSEQALTLAGDPANTTPALERLGTENVLSTYTLQLDYTRPLAERTRLETGYKGTRRAMDNDLTVTVWDYGQDSYVENPLRSNAFDYDDLVNAGYAVLHQGVGRVDVQAGLRAEHASRDFTLRNTGESFPKHYWSFFPSGLVAVNLDEQQQVRLSYSRRIQRPDTRLLNPFAFNEDRFNRSVGNPQLEPEYTHALELGYQRSMAWGSMQLTPFFRRTQNAIRRIREVRGDTTFSTFRNLATAESYGADANASVRAGRVSGFASVSAFRTVSDAGDLGQNYDADGIGWSARVSANLQVTPRLDVQGFLMYRAPMDVEQGRIGSMTMSTLSLRQKVMGDRGALSLRIVDPLNRMGFSLLVNDPLYLQRNERHFNGRAAHLTFSYNFGQQPRLRNRPNNDTPTDSSVPSAVGP